MPSDQLFFRVLVQKKDYLINQRQEPKYFIGEPGAEVPGCWCRLKTEEFFSDWCLQVLSGEDYCLSKAKNRVKSEPRNFRTQYARERKSK